MTTYRPATEDDARYVGQHLRDSDRREIERAGSPWAPTHAPLKSLCASLIAWTAVGPSGQPMAVFGVGAHPTRPQTGIVWLLGTPELSRAGRALVRGGRYYKALMHTLFPILTNAIDHENLSSRLWLQMLGFTMSKACHISPTGHPFIIFTSEVPHV